MSDSALHSLVGDAAGRFLSRAEAGPWDNRRPRHLDWDPDEIVFHVATIIDYFREIVLGSGSSVESLFALADDNARRIEGHRRDDWTALLADINAGVEEILAQLSEDSDERRYTWHGGISLGTTEVMAVLAGELLIHDWDLARTLRQPTSLSKADARVLIPALHGVLPHVLDLDRARATDRGWRIHIGGIDPFDIRISNGVMTVELASGQVDCHIRSEPRAFLLASYDRVGVVRAALSGRVISYGRRPLLGLTLTKLLLIP